MAMAVALRDADCSTARIVLREQYATLCDVPVEPASGFADRSNRRRYTPLCRAARSDHGCRIMLVDVIGEIVIDRLIEAVVFNVPATMPHFNDSLVCSHAAL